MTEIDILSRIAAQNQIAAQTGVAGTGSQAAKEAGAPATGSGSFADALAAASADQGVTFSGHAQTRLASRQITLSSDDLQRLGSALTRAAAKGARSSLVLMDSQSGRVGLVVSVPNRTVITAVDTNSLKENIFTNIDSAMIV
jgi:flagellar operon protein